MTAGSTFGRGFTLALVGSLIATLGLLSSSVEANAAASSINVVSSGGAAEGSGWTETDGVIAATSSVNINASEIASALTTGDLEVRADAITVDAAIVWAQSTRLTLNAGSGALAINANIWASGADAGLVLNGNYRLAAGNGVSIQLTGASPTLSINNQAFTVVNTQAQLTSLNSSSTFIALGRSLSLTDVYNAALISGPFTSVFDGLGNEVSGLTVSAAASGVTNLGFFAELRGATVRNLGVTNVSIQSSSASDANQIRAGGIAGSIGNASLTGGQSATAYTTVLDRVWSSGSIFAKDTGSGSPDPDTQGKYFAGGLVGSVNNGTANIMDSFSSASVGSSGTLSGNLAVGGLIGDSGSNKSGSITGQNSPGGQQLTIERSYATGTVVEGQFLGYYGTGGLVGVFYGDDSSFVKDSYSWTTIIGVSPSIGGIWGVPASSSQEIETSYTTYSQLSGGYPDNNFVNSYSGATNNTWSTLPTGFSADIWQITSGSMPTLKGQATPQTALYIKVVAPTDGTYATMSYAIVDAAGNVQNLTTLGLSDPTGTPEYTIPSTAPVGVYSVSYDSGLEPAGTNAERYFFAPFATPTSVTITSSPSAQTVSWSPTNTSATTNVSSLTPNAAATSSGTGAISYTVISSGTTGCSVSSSNPPVISFTAAGDCVVRALAAGNATYASASKDVIFTFTAPLTQTVTWAPNNASVLTTASPLTPSSLATSSGSGAVSYSVQSAGATNCSVNSSSAVLTFSAAGSCVVRATAASNATYASAFIDVTFTITALQTQTVSWAPTNTQILANASPLTPSALATSSGTGPITYAVQSAGATQCAVNSSTGVVTFSAGGECVLRATAAANATFASAFKDVTFVIGSTTTAVTLNLDIAVGDPTANAPVEYATTGLAPGSQWELIVRSNPQTLAGGVVNGAGIVLGSNTLPAGLSPGWHSLTFSSTGLSGGFVATTVWFEVSATGSLIAVQASEPTDEQKKADELSRTGSSVGIVALTALLVLSLGAGLVLIRRMKKRSRLKS